MKPNESIQIEFIKDRLRNGQSRKDILQEFTETYKTSVKTFDTRLKIATEAIRGESSRILEVSEAYVKEEIEGRKLKLMTVAERMDVLSKIAGGEIPLFKPMVVNGEIQMVDVVPDWMDRKNAIAELNKMDGSYSATKTEVAITDGLKSITINPASLRKNDSDTPS